MTLGAVSRAAEAHRRVRGSSSPARRISFAWPGVRTTRASGSSDERVAQGFGIRFVGAIGGPLETERILDALLRLVGANHPRAGSAVVFVLGRLTNPRTPPHFGDAAAPHVAGDPRLFAIASSPAMPEAAAGAPSTNGLACRDRAR